MAKCNQLTPLPFKGLIFVVRIVDIARRLSINLFADLERVAGNRARLKKIGLSLCSAARATATCDSIALLA